MLKLISYHSGVPCVRHQDRERRSSGGARWRERKVHPVRGMNRLRSGPDRADLHRFRAMYEWVGVAVMVRTWQAHEARRGRRRRGSLLHGCETDPRNPIIVIFEIVRDNNGRSGCDEVCHTVCVVVWVVSAPGINEAIH